MGDAARRKLALDDTVVTLRRLRMQAAVIDAPLLAYLIEMAEIEAGNASEESRALQSRPPPILGGCPL